MDTGTIWRNAERVAMEKRTAHTDTRYAAMLEEAVSEHIKTEKVSNRSDEECQAAREAAETFILGVLEERGFSKLVRQYKSLKAKTPW